MTWRAGKLLGAALLLALAAWIGRGLDAAGSATSGAGADEPVARALRPLGPVKAILSAVLWTDLMRSQRAGDGERIASLARALLSIHPDLDSVREHLAYQLIVSEARRAPDRERHGLLITRGLEILDDGLELGDAGRIHAATGRLLYDRRERDPWFPRAVELAFGATPEELAIEHLRLAPSADPLESMILASLLVERGVRRLVTDVETVPARRDLEEAVAVLGRSEVGPEDRESVLQPLQVLLELAESGEDPRPHDPYRERWSTERRRELIEPEEP